LSSGGGLVTGLPQELDSTVAISGAPMSRAERVQVTRRALVIDGDGLLELRNRAPKVAAIQ
jgi:hypothetical protein